MDSKFLNIHQSNSLLITHWSALEFTSLHSVLSAHLDDKTVNEICDETIPSAVAAKRLHDKVLQAVDDNLYLAILNYCQDKQEQLSNLLNTMSIDLQEFADGEKNKSQLTRNQHNILLSKHCELVEIFTNSLNSCEISSLLKKHCPRENELPSGYFLHKMLLKQDKKPFYKEVCEMLRNKHDKYKECFDFMRKMNDVAVRTSLTQLLATRELLLMKYQLAEMRNSVGNFALEFTDEMCDLKKTLKKSEISINTQCETMEKTIAQHDQAYYARRETNEMMQNRNMKKLHEKLSQQEEQIQIFRKEFETFKEITNKKEEDLLVENCNLRQKLNSQAKQIHNIKITNGQNENNQLRQKLSEQEEKYSDFKYEFEIFKRNTITTEEKITTENKNIRDALKRQKEDYKMLWNENKTFKEQSNDENKKLREKLALEEERVNVLQKKIQVQEMFEIYTTAVN